MFRLERIETTYTDDGFSFSAVIAGGEKLKSLPCDRDHLLSYQAMQHHVLEWMGGMLLEPTAEGRTDADADRCWRIVTGGALDTCAALNEQEGK